MTWLAVLVTKFFERFYPMAHQRAYLSWLSIAEESREVWEPDELWQPEGRPSRDASPRRPIGSHAEERATDK